MQVEVKTRFSGSFAVFRLIFGSFQPLFLENENHKQKNNHSLESLCRGQDLENIEIFI